MGVLGLALPPLAPSFKHLSDRSTGNDVNTVFHMQLPLRKPNRTHETSKLQTEPAIQNQEAATTKRPVQDYGARQSDSYCSTSDILRLMDSLALPFFEDIYSSLAKECTVKSDRRGAYALMVHIMNSGVRPTVPLLNRLLVMNFSCGYPDIARHLFGKMPRRDFHSWAIVILGCIDVGCYHEANALFAAMLKHQNDASGIPPWIMGCVLKACTLNPDLALGKQVHALCHKLGFTKEDSYLSVSLIRFYGKLSSSEDANLILDQLSFASTIVWAAKIANDHRGGQDHEVIHNFNEMGKNGIRKNTLVFSNVFRACASVGDCGRCGQQVHANAIKLGFESDIVIRNRLVDMYGKCGLVKDAERAFEVTKVETRDVKCCNSMIAGYMENGFYVEAIKLLYQMKASGIEVQDDLLNEVKITSGFNNYTKI